MKLRIALFTSDGYEVAEAVEYECIPDLGANYTKFDLKPAWKPVHWELMEGMPKLELVLLITNTYGDVYKKPLAGLYGEGDVVGFDEITFSFN